MISAIRSKGVEKKGGAKKDGTKKDEKKKGGAKKDEAKCNIGFNRNVLALMGVALPMGVRLPSVGIPYHNRIN
ncbi:MAG: hypothetical protein COW92_03500 [Candidatus Omnitrophica bacterium CG22_combo_CG10-13_8_21_14_all_43_16]|nr:MAG: hypothetical protein COW92_03500 [Candidatus Omnitrophica bacterium CG22_combo_CG10-13_8_21_14_all_43_16]